MQAEAAEPDTVHELKTSQTAPEASHNPRHELRTPRHRRGAENAESRLAYGNLGALRCSAVPSYFQSAKGYRSPRQSCNEARSGRFMVPMHAGMAWGLSMNGLAATSADIFLPSFFCLLPRSFMVPMRDS